MEKGQPMCIFTMKSEKYLDDLNKQLQTHLQTPVDKSRTE